MTGTGLRAKRVAESIRHHLTQAIARDLGDPRLASLVVTDVGVPDDLSIAWVRVRSLTGDDDDRARSATMRSLRRAAGRLRRGLGPAVRLKRVPELRFEYDTGQDAARRIDGILEEIHEEREARGDDDE